MKLKYRILISTLVLFYLNSLVYAEMDIENSSQAISKQEIKEVTKQKSKAKPKKKYQTNWPAAFIPSEKINADSSVSFPVDI